MLYIKGGRKKIIQDIERNMKQAAKDQNFEMAVLYRNQLRDMQALQQKIMFGDKEFLDISKDKALADLHDLFGLKRTPARIEGFDISHMCGRNVVASMVVFSNGVSDRAEYRKFKVSERNDDYANMHEVISRRFSEKNLKSWGTPDLLLVDGGKGQLEAAIAALKGRGVKIPVVSVAKRNEEIIVHSEDSNVDLSVVKQYESGEKVSHGVAVARAGVYYEVNLHAGQMNASGHSKNLRGITAKPARYVHVTKLIQRVRDESHRFAISYHTVLKRAGQTKSRLEDVPGVGPATRKLLLKTFGSLRGVEQAGEVELAKAVGQKKAASIFAHLHNKA